MTKTKKLLARVASIAASAIFCTAAVTSVPASGLERYGEEYTKQFKNVTPVDDYLDWNQWYYKNNNSYCHVYKINGDSEYELYGDNKYELRIEEIIKNSFEFTLTENDDITISDEEIRALLDKFDSTYVFASKVNEDADEVITVTDKNLNPETVQNARAICTELKEKGLIKDFVYYGDMAEVYDATWIPTKYSVSTYGDDLFSKLENYVNEKELDCTVVEQTRTCELVSNSKMTFEEYAYLAKQIENDLGYIPGFWYEEFSISYMTTVDMFNAVYGDATNDSNIDLYDAVEISKGIMGMRTFNDKEKIIADYNGDGEVDLYDAIGIAKYIMSNK